jgi:hypothetical protein
VQVTGRRATVLLLRRGQLIGQLPPLALEMPWWPEANDLVTAVRERNGIDITVLRLLRTVSDRIAGGEITYLAETDCAPDSLLPADDDGALHDHPLRQLWASPGGPAALLAWADDQLSSQEIRRTGPAEQMRTWNLSALWRLPTSAGPIWLKAVPDFFGHEGAVIDWIGEPTAPRLYAFAHGRSLIADVPGTPNHDVHDPDALRPMVDLLVDLQRRGVGQLDQLTGVGVPDRRLDRMVPEIADVVADGGAALSVPERRALDALVSSLPSRLTSIADCGVPDTLVHGDFHAGNVAGRPGGYVILDWGDSFIGHPLIDELAFVERLPRDVQIAARSWFVGAWETIAPGCDPGRAVELLDPVLPLLAAAMYARFCAAIEPTERIYHSSDLVRMLRTAATATSS